MDYFKLTQDALSVEEVTSLITDPSCGAISLFVGTTRDNFQGKIVERLEYEAYNEMAEKEMHKLCKQAREKWSLKHIALYHRLGLVPVTESSVIVAVSSEHRRESLDAVSFLIDSLKASVPIWKKEVYSDGSGEWKKNKECVWVKNGGSSDYKVDGTISIRKRAVTDEGKSINDEPALKKIKREDDSDSQCEEPFAPEEKASVQQKELITQKPKEKHNMDPDFVQIVASKEELERRIAAFQQRKREELDVLNVQEFCTLSGGGSSLNSCARTSAVVLRSKGSRSHLRLTHVVNDWGPQTVGMDLYSVPHNQNITQKQEGGSSSSGSSREGSIEPSFLSVKEAGPETKCNKESVGIQGQEIVSSGIEERIHNLESHLNFLPGPPVPRDVYKRLKLLEDRVLHLEGMSPEYFRDKTVKIPDKSSKQKEIKAVEDDISVDELDVKIYQLKMKLKQKQIKQVF
ncbi:molybdopterin synthase catalytic subunit isoform X1 [Panulirus ornatus]|uniref:molybdopterin synthase catalytic subunit isoform X1 n=1 Tax=Panulirus ornatus TaxID=150431 RepID=UPI003A8AD5E2